MDIIQYFALEQMVRERRRRRQKVFVTAEIDGAQREGKIIREKEGRWLIEFFAGEVNGRFNSTLRRYLGLREFSIHPIDYQQFQQHIEAIYDSYNDLDFEP